MSGNKKFMSHHSCDVSTGLVPRDSQKSNLVVKNVITAKSVTACEAVVGKIRAHELLVGGSIVGSGVGSYYFANGGSALDGFTILLPMREVSESFTGNAGPVPAPTNVWPTQFSGNQTNWIYTVDNAVALIDGSVGAYLKWNNVLVNVEGTYSFRTLYYYTTYDENTSPTHVNNSAIIQIFVDGVAASSTYDTSTVSTPGQPNYFLVALMEDVELSAGMHTIEIRVVGSTPPPVIPNPPVPFQDVGFVLASVTAVKTS